jgi:NAD(P)-dependent dehydrogenase (short-subunit alcohol dehydrogenase family)
MGEGWGERDPWRDGANRSRSPLSRTPLPEGRLDQDVQQADLRGRNSWHLLMAEVPSVELLEVQLFNAIAPFLINARLEPLMLRTPERDKHIVNVSAVEGQFYRSFKTTRHPHTNMAKAALNMMTRTSATDYHGDGIHMNSVDTAWVTDEDPIELAAREQKEERFHPPLDIIDGADRGSDHRRDQHGEAFLGAVLEGLQADGLVRTLST